MNKHSLVFVWITGWWFQALWKLEIINQLCQMFGTITNVLKPTTRSCLPVTIHRGSHGWTSWAAIKLDQPNSCNMTCWKCWGKIQWQLSPVAGWNRLNHRWKYLQIPTFWVGNGPWNCVDHLQPTPGQTESTWSLSIALMDRVPKQFINKHLAWPNSSWKESLQGGLMLGKHYRPFIWIARPERPEIFTLLVMKLMVVWRLRRPGHSNLIGGCRWLRPMDDQIMVPATVPDSRALRNPRLGCTSVEHPLENLFGKSATHTYWN